MRVDSNVHTHTTYSDGANPPEDMIRAALARGFSSLGFSDHGWAPHDECAMSPRAEEEYRAEIRRLKRAYAGRIEIALGYEHDASMPDTDLTPYDYAIESVHFVKPAGEYLSVDHTEAISRSIVQMHYGGDPYGLVRDYFDAVCASIEASPAQIIGHIGLVSKFNEGGRMFSMDDPRWLEPARQALRLAVEKDRLVEVNTGAMSRGYRSEPYPDRALLRALKQMGGRVILTSDCHRAEWIDFAFDEVLEMIRQAGFREIWVWKDGGFQSRGL